MNYSTRKFSILALIVVFIAFSTCSSPTGGGEQGTVTISLGGENSLGRWAFPFPQSDVPNISHTIKLHNGPGPEQSRAGVKIGNRSRSIECFLRSFLAALIIRQEKLAG